MFTPRSLHVFLKTMQIVFVLLCPLIVSAQTTPLPNAFAHNDYIHHRPLFEALDDGYTNIEADIFLMNDDNLVVAHMFPYFRQERTLERLYLQPLKQRVQQNGGWVYKNYQQPVILMIDIKTGATNTYAALEKLLDRYSDILTHYDDGVVKPGAITVVISGHKPYLAMAQERHRLAFIDQDLRRGTRDTLDEKFYVMSSCKYSKLMQWKGNGPMPAADSIKLTRYVGWAHRYRRKVRLWASPEKRAVWAKLLSCGVDLINTDKLGDLRSFLEARQPVGTYASR